MDENLTREQINLKLIEFISSADINNPAQLITIEKAFKFKKLKAEYYLDELSKGAYVNISRIMINNVQHKSYWPTSRGLNLLSKDVKNDELPLITEINNDILIPVPIDIIEPLTEIEPVTEEEKVSLPSIGKDQYDLDITIDLQRLVQTRMLIQASSGGGKSYAMRRILEQTSNDIQQIIIDPEGEFRTLAKEFPYLVCATEDADIPINFCSGRMLAREIMSKKVSVIIDISDFESESRGVFVASFISELMRLPQELWSHVLLFIDESHLFCPQQDKSPAKKAIIDVAGRGRKRGICAILATQRISKLNKSVAAELLNRLIGMTYLDIDIKRSADEMGISASSAMEMLPALKVGEFYCYGPAISHKIQKVKIGPVKSSHGFLTSEITPPATITAELLDEIKSNFNKITIDMLKEEAEELEAIATNKEDFIDEVYEEMEDWDFRSKLETTLLVAKSKGHIDAYTDNDINEAIHRYYMLKGITDVNVHQTTLFKYKARYQAAEKKFGEGIIGLLPVEHKKGNRNRKIEQRVLDLIHAHIKNTESSNLNFNQLYQKICDECESLKLTAPSSKTVRKEIKTFNSDVKIAKEQSYI